MKISEAKATQTTGSEQSVYDWISYHLADLHKTAAHCPMILQRVAALQAAFIIAGEQEDMADIVQTWQKDNLAQFNQDLSDDYFALGLDSSAQGRAYHQISKVVAYMLEPMVCQAETVTKPTLKQPTTRASLPPSGQWSLWSGGLVSVGQRVAGILVQQSVNTLSTAVMPSKTGLKEPLL